ncbi:hypothetical protein BO82DRAFT_435303 [Aspergillus uvarum CBS 121591]|uniref:Uncharacterized protein n=1 Tax=Aspergillus uvarum CBS 121591 TaxID=1448315 RepID=A0A319BZ49_9EURO|nr:hypothetical protein BO82DRAFT_435303 [Aspergillus uvarum CBS 121591]PYH78044.1 hypothetical protein BO82DRAFT_435303 [Aspergillus uvarum CBS 121591]
MIVHHLNTAHRAISPVILASWIVYVLILMAMKIGHGGTLNPIRRFASPSLLIFLVCRLIVNLRPATSIPSTWLYELYSASIMIYVFTMFSFILYMCVLMGVHHSVATTAKAGELGLRAWTVSPPIGREDLADRRPPELAQVVALVYELMTDAGIDPDTAHQWMHTW